MRRNCIHLYTTILVFLLTVILHAEKSKTTDRIIIDTFSSCSKEFTPCDWKSAKKDNQMFSMKHENGNYYLEVDSHDDSNTLAKRVNYRIDEYPFLSWRWRVRQLPKGGNENKKSGNDSGAGVYVVFKGSFGLNQVLKYVWSTSLDIGTITKSPYNGRTKIIVLQSGPGKLNQWISQRVDVRKDYQKLFGNNPPPVEAIALMTDSDDTKSSASADYDDFVISK